MICANPIATARSAQEGLGVTKPTALRLLSKMAEIGVLTETSEGARGQRRYVAQEMMRAVAGGSDE